MADVVATAPGFASTDKQREVWDVVTEVVEGTALIQIGSDRVGVAYTPSGGSTISKTIGGLTVSGFPSGGASLPALKCSVATDGSFEFPVTGLVPATANGVKVYAIVTGNRITELTLTVGTNKLFGVVNNPLGYTSVSTKAVVKIGAGL